MNVDWTDLTGFQRDMLEAINRIETREDDSEPYGLGVQRELEDLGYGRIRNARLYNNLDTLVEAELVEKTKINDRKKRYSLTAGSEQLLQRRARELAELCDLPLAVATDGGRDIEEIGVPKAEGESWAEAVDRRRRDDRDGDWYHCICGRRYRSPGSALKCCSNCFGEDATAATAGGEQA